ncbi:MAG: hypothetical protein HXY23_05900 [Parvularculaceae bacterium]|nr:hypothetical protein [Parvularculaceae bacterium]
MVVLNGVNAAATIESYDINMALSVPPRKDVFQHHPVANWLVAVVVLCLGIGFLVIAARETAAGGPLLPALGAAAVGFIGLAMSIFAARHAERITIEFDVERRLVRFTGHLPWRTRHAEWSFDEIAKLKVETWDDGEGKVWRPLLALKNGDVVPLTTWQSDDARVDALRDHGNALLGQ